MPAIPTICRNRDQPIKASRTATTAHLIAGLKIKNPGAGSFTRGRRSVQEPGVGRLSLSLTRQLAKYCLCHLLGSSARSKRHLLKLVQTYVQIAHRDRSSLVGPTSLIDDKLKYVARERSCHPRNE